MIQFDRLQTRLNIVFILLTVVPLLITSILISQRSIDVIRGDAQAYLLERSKHITSEIEAFIEGRTNTLLYIAQVNGLSDNEQSALINGMLAFDTTFQEIAVLDASGMEIERVSRSDVVQTEDYRDRSGNPEFTTIAEDGDQIYHSDVRFDTELREPIMTISVPIRDRRTGALDKVLVADFRFRAVWDLLNTQEYRTGETAYVVDEIGEVVAHRNRSAALRDALRETGFTIPTSRTGWATNASGEEVLFAIQPIRVGDREFIAVAEQTTTQALSLARDVQVITAVVITVMLVVVGGLIMLVVRYFVRPIEHLSHVAEQIANGDLTSRAHVQGRGEIPSLARSFNAMTDQLSGLIIDLEQRLEDLRRMEIELREKHNQLERFFVLAPDLLCIADTDGQFVKVNQAWKHILGYDTVSLEGEQFLDYVHPDDRQRTRDAIATLESQQSIKQFVNRYRTRQGEYRLIEWNSQPNGKYIYAAAQDITDRQQAEQLKLDIERLKASFQKEQAQNALIQRFISMLSHDLRTPLAVIASSRDMLIRYYDRLSEEKRREKLDAIGRQVQFALEILQDTVNMARGNLSERDFHPVPISLATLCEVSAQEIQAARHDDHVIRFINLVDVGIVYIDEVLVSRILLNLLSNALKYSPQGGEIRLELDQHDKWIVLRVIDEGTGISETDLPHLFEPFYRADEVNHIEGTGLGLSIVKDCVDRHRGRVHVESSLGKGSTFIVELPGNTVEETQQSGV